MRNGLTAILAGTFGIGLGGCGDSGTGVDESPTAIIVTIRNEGMQQNNLDVSGIAIDDQGLDSLRIDIDDQYQQSMTLHGTREDFEVTVNDAPVGTHQLQFKVFDNAGNIGRTSAQFTVPEPVPIYDAKIYIMRGSQIEPE